MEATYAVNRGDSSTLAKVYAYVALGLLLTALVSLGVGAVVAKALVGDNPELAMEKYSMLIVISGIALLVDGIVMRVVMIRNNHSGWIPYIIYCTLFGIFLSSFVVAGIPFYIFAEAFGISALVFLILFLIGYFSPFNLNMVTSIMMSLLLGLIIMGLFFGITYLVAPGLFNGFYVLLTGGVLLFMLICIATDGYNIKRIISSGCVNSNMILYCASTLYTDFIYIFIRVLYVILRLTSKKN